MNFFREPLTLSIAKKEFVKLYNEIVDYQKESRSYDYKERDRFLADKLFNIKGHLTFIIEHYELKGAKNG